MRQIESGKWFIHAQHRGALAFADVPAGGGWDAAHTSPCIWWGKKAVLLVVEEKPMSNGGVIVNRCQLGEMEATFTHNYEPRQFLYITDGDQNYIIPYVRLRPYLLSQSQITLTRDQIINEFGIQPLTIEETQRYFRYQKDNPII